MAEVITLNISDDFAKKVKDADSEIKKLVTTTENAKNVIIQHFKEMGDMGVGYFIQKINEASQSISKLGAIQINSNGTTKAIDDINLLINAMTKLSESQLTSLSNKHNSSFYKQLLNDAKEYRNILDEIGRKLIRQNKQNISEHKIALEQEKTYTMQMIAAEKEKQAGISRTIAEVKRLAQAYKAMPTSLTSKNVGKIVAQTMGASTINQHLAAISNLKTAIKDLDTGQKNYQATLNKLNSEIARHKAELEKLGVNTDNVRKKQSNLMDTTGQLKRQLAGLFSISAIQGYMNKLVGVRKEFELQQRSLQVLLQSKDQADKLWNQTLDLAVKSPFRVKELVSYTKQLAAYRIETDKLHDTTKRLADVSAGLGVDMQRLILAFGQVSAANFLRGTELRQFTEAGIPMLDELAKYFTELEGRMVSAGDVFERISKRMVSFSDVEEVFRRMTDAGGVFFNMQEEQSKTLAGMISNLHDSIDLMFNEIGASYDGLLKGSVNFAKFFVENWELMGAAIKGVLLALSSYKLYQLAAKDAMIQTAVAQGVLNSQGVKQLSLIQLLNVGWNKLALSIKNAGSSFKAFMAFNIPLMAITSAISAIWELTSAAIEHEKVLKDITKQYDELRKKSESINVKFNIATQDKDIKTQKAKLKELVALANNDYNMNIKVNVEGMSSEQVQNKFTEISKQIFDANIFAEHFAKQMQKATEWVVEDDIFEDLEQLGNKANDVLYELSLNRERIVFDLQKSQDKLNESQREALEMLKQPKQIDESEVDYLERLSKGYSLVIDEYSTLKDALKNTKDASTASKLNVEFSKIQDTFKRLNIDASSLYSLLNNYDKTIDEAKTEFEEFAKTLDLNKNLTDEQKEIRLKTAIDKLASEKGWNDFVKNYIYRWTEEEFKIKFKPVIAEEGPLKPWQETYNRLFRGMEGFRAITKNTTKQKEIIDRLNGSIKETEDLINRINRAGGIKATSKGGAYEGVDLSQLNNALLELKKQRDWLGGSESGKEKDSESKILKNRISLIKELNKEYEKLNKTFDATTSKEKVLESFGDTFKQAFKGTGISLSSMVVNTNALNDLKNTGELAGKTLSESMIKEIEQLKEAGTYIRNFDEDFLLSIKHLEGFRAEAYKDAGGVWTQGYGETINIERGKVWDEEKATMVLRDSLTKRYVSQLNEVLDDNKELVLTQKQYNALLDLTYQGGKGAAISILERTKDISKGVDYINLIASKIKDTMGSKEAERFGEAFVNKFKEAESVYERIAMLLEVSNLTIKGGINKEWYKGMQKRSDERSSVFRGDLETSKVLQEVLVSISDIDFTNIEGVIHQLKQLAPLAKKEGKEAELALSKAISELEVQVGSKKKSEQDKEMIDYIEEMFSGYEMSIELQKLNIPKDLAKQLFNIDALTLPELKNKVVSMESKFVGTDMEEEYRKFLKKIDEMEEKAQMERLKKYTKYLVQAQSERVKIKIDEMNQLAEIDKLDISDTDKSIMKQDVRDETKEKLDKDAWEVFKSSDMYIQIFEDLDMASSKALSKMQQKLSELRSSLGDLPPEDLKEIVRLQEQIAKAKIDRNPFKGLITSIKALSSARKELNKLEEEHGFTYEEGLEIYEQQREKIDELAISIDKLTKEYGEDTPNAIFEKEDLDRLKKANKELAEILEKMGLLNNTVTSSEIGIRDSFGGMADIFEQAAQSTNELADAFDKIHGLNATQRDTFETISGVFSGMGGIMRGAEKMASGNPFAVVTGAIQSLSSVMSIVGEIFAIGDKKKERQIQREIKFVEDLERAYQKLEKQIDKSYTLDTLKRSYDNANKNLNEQIAARQRMIQQEEDKKKTDNDRIKEWQQEIEDLREQQEELLKTQVDELGGGYDYSSMTEEFVDAWISAYKEAGDGLKGLEDNFDEFFKNIAIKQAVMGGASKILEPFFNAVNKALENDFKIDDSEMAVIDKLGEQSMANLDDFLKQWYSKWGEYMGSEGQGELSGLQRGIQSVSESTAQIIEAYLNSVRFYVADSNTKLTQLVNQVVGGENTPNPMLSELRSQTELIRSIRDMFGSVIKQGHSTFGGAFLKVSL